jgi:hypothetical protein
VLQLLAAILCVLKNSLLAIAWAGAELVNGLIIAVGAFGALLVLLLPQMPSPAPAPSGGILGFINWVVPLGPLLDGLLLIVGLWIGYLAVRAALKWVKYL